VTGITARREGYHAAFSAMHSPAAMGLPDFVISRSGQTNMHV